MNVKWGPKLLSCYIATLSYTKTSIRFIVATPVRTHTSPIGKVF